MYSSYDFHNVNCNELHNLKIKNYKTNGQNKKLCKLKSQNTFNEKYKHYIILLLEIDCATYNFF